MRISVHPRLEKIVASHFGDLGTLPESLRAFVSDLGRVFEEAAAPSRCAEDLGSLEEVLRDSTVILYRIDRHGIFTLAEGEALRAMGFGSGELVGQHALQAFGAHPHASAALRRALTGERFTCLLPFAGGAILEATHIPRLDEAGRYDGTVGVVVDVTKRERALTRLRESEELLRESQTVAAIGSYSLEVASGTWISSPALDHIFGIDPNAPKNVETWGALVHPEDREDMLNYLREQVLSRRQKFDREYRVVRASDGRVRWIHGLGVLTFGEDGSPVKMLGTIQDITERKLAEQIAARARDELEIRVAERTRQLRELNTTLEQARISAEAASHAKSRFLAMMSHEIRTPLNGVIGVLHLLGREPLTAQQRRWVDLADTSSSTLLRVINDVLDFSKVEAGRLELLAAPSDLLTTIQRTASTFAERARAKGLAWNLAIDSDMPRRVIADPDRLAQVLGNLLGNALKFTESGSVGLRVTRINPVAEAHARVRFEVHDTGEGMHPEQLHRLFQPFSQLDNSSTRRHGGTGLGLGICKHLVELMRGEIGVRSQPGEGSTFWFEVCFSPAEVPPGEQASGERVLPVVRSAPELPQSQSAGRPRRPNGEAPRALLAEDNLINQELAREMIRFAGIECDCVDNGRDAIQAALSGRYDMVFMDCMMPDLDGCAATRAIRAEECRRTEAGRPGRRLPIIAMTANVLENDRAECAAAGMDDFLGKPLDPDEVADRCGRWWPEA